MTPKRIFRWATLLILIMATLLTALVGGVFEQAVATAPTDFSCADVSEIPLIECEALTALYTSTAGDNWTNNEGWLLTTTPCSWHGLACAAGHITRLSLSHNELSGNVPSQLGNLASLVYLNLSINQLTGSIPSQLGNLASLQWLLLSDNQLAGTPEGQAVPPELGNLASLEWLYLSNNELTGSIPPELGNLASLQWLSLHNNQLTGTPDGWAVPPELGNLASLVYLNLSNNELTGSIPPELGDLASLHELYLYNNQLTGTPAPERWAVTPEGWAVPPELGNLASLQALYLHDNQLTGSIPPQLGNLANLQALVLSNNQLTGNIPPQLGNLASLAYLYLHDNQLTGSIPPQLGNLASLQGLDLHSSQLTGSVPPELGNLASLQALDLSHNQLTGAPDGWAVPPELGNLANLQGLYLNDNPQLAGSLPVTLTQLSLQSFWFNDTGLCEPPYADFQGWLASIPNVRSTGVLCDFALCTDQSDIPQTECAALETLYTNTDGDNWSNNDGWLVTTAPCNWFGVACDAGHVTQLSLGGNQLSGAIPPQIDDLTRLVTLDLNTNQLTSTLPLQLGYLFGLQELVLNDNPLSGDLPESLVNLELNRFWFHGTDLCEPSSTAFQAWLAGIPDLRRTGVLCSPCSLTVALQEQANSHGDLQTLRRFRDEVLAASPAGQQRIDRYYRHSPEIAWLLLKDAGLRARTARLLHELMPGIRATLKEPDGQEVILTAARVKRINGLLDAIAQRASPGLRSAIEQLQAEVADFEGRPLSALWLSAAP